MNLHDILWSAAQAVLAPESAGIALAAIGHNIQNGFTGLMNFGQAGFMLVGAYGLGIGVVTLGLPIWLSLVLSVGLSLALALLLGLPTLRLRADYFAIVSLAITETLRLLVRSNWLAPITGGVNGLQRFGDGFYAWNPIPPGHYGFGPWQWNEAHAFLLLVAWSLVALICALTWMLMRSPWGRVVKSIRENETAAISLGKPVFLYKMQSLIVGGLVGSLAGVVLALSQQDVNPETFMPIFTFFAYTALILGGVGRIWGPVVGAFVFWAILAATDSVMAQLSSGILVSSLSGQVTASVRFVLVGVGLMCLVTFRPQGLFWRGGSKAKSNAS
jgi:branched-chain amino acid transport system permease protein